MRSNDTHITLPSKTLPNNCGNTSLSQISWKNAIWWYPYHFSIKTLPNNCNTPLLQISLKMLSYDAHIIFHVTWPKTLPNKCFLRNLVMDLSPVYGMLNDSHCEYSLMASKLSNSAQVISNLSVNPRPAQDVNRRCNFSQDESWLRNNNSREIHSLTY